MSNMVADEVWREHWYRYYRNRQGRQRLTVWRNPVETVPGHQSACFAGERQEKRGLK